MNQQKAKAISSCEDSRSDSASVPLYQEATTATEEEVVLEVSPASISQAHFEAASAANPEELTKAMEEIQALLDSLEGTQSTSAASTPPMARETLWPEDLNTGSFRGTVEKAQGPTWGFDPGFEAEGT